ncbi:MAG: substrate-binding domain-containing protein, partial [Methanocorpusculum sp.]|nr:substrate-binding domain-containing protein [Methanocorpusculum sp.]
QDDGHAGYVDAFMANVITQVDAVDKIKSYLTLGEADASIVYVSDISKADKASIDILPIEDKYNVIADYPYGVLKNTEHAEAVAVYEAFLTGEKGSAILTDYGFSPVA